MEKCNEYLYCSKTGCPAYGNDFLVCWEVEDTHCHHYQMGNDFFNRKGLNKCKLCMYFKNFEKQYTSKNYFS